MNSTDFYQMLPYAPDEPAARHQNFRRPKGGPIRRSVIGAGLVVGALVLGGVVGKVQSDDQSASPGMAASGSNSVAVQATYETTRPRTDFLVPQTIEFRPAPDSSNRFSFEGRTVRVADRPSSGPEVAIYDRAAVGIVGTFEAASPSTSLTVRFKDQKNFWALTPVPAYGGFELSRIEAGSVKKRFALQLMPSDPGTAVALVDAPDRLQVVIQGKVELEVITEDLTNNDRVGLVAMGATAGSWSAVAVWG